MLEKGGIVDLIAAEEKSRRAYEWIGFVYDRGTDTSVYVL